MIEFIRSWVFNIVTLVIFIVLIEILIPTGKIKKFINLVSGFILLIAIINPLLGLFNQGVSLKEFYTTDNYLMDKAEIEASSSTLKHNQMKQVSKLYKKKISQQIEDSVKSVNGIIQATAEVIINEDYKSESFGEIKKIYLSVRLGEKKEGVKSVATVEKITVNGGDKSKKEESKIDREIKKQLQEKIKKMFDLDEESVAISLQEKG